MKNRKFALPILAAVGVMGMLGVFLVLPGEVYAWSSCDLQPAIDLFESDVAVASDGTVYAVIASPQNAIQVVKFQSGSCNATKIPNAGEISTASKVSVDQTTPTDKNPPPPINPENAQTGFDPKIAVSPSGDVVITFREQAGGYPYSVFFQRKPAGSNQFNNPIQITNEGYVGGLALDSSNNVHVVYYRSANNTGGFYRKYNAQDQLTVNTIELTSFYDAEPEVAVDSQNGANIVYMTGANPHIDLKYKHIDASGNVGPEIDIANTSGNSIWPDISVDLNDEIDIAWQGRVGSSPYQPYYRHCTQGAASCGAQHKLANTTTGVDGVDVTACGSGPYVTWQNKDSGKFQIFVSANLAAPKVLGEGIYNASDQGAGFVHVLFRSGKNGHARYARQADSTCQTSGGPPQPTNTPTNGPPPPSATPTLTPVTTTKQRIDDKNSAIIYAPQGGWSRQNGGAACLYNGGFHYASGSGKTATYTFTGTKVKYWYLTYTNFGTAEVLIDGQVVGTVSERNADTLCKAWKSPLLPRAQHTIQIRPKSGTGNITLDLLTIFP